MAKVLNKYKDEIPKGAVYVGRPTKFGNPFPMATKEDRGVVVQKYREYVQQNPELIKAIKKELCGKDLVCFCAPLPCHADILLEIANSP